MRLDGLLQPLAHGVANRPRGLAIDRLAIMGIKAGHSILSRTPGVRWRCGEVSQCNSLVRGLFPGPLWGAWDLGKICMNEGAGCRPMQKNSGTGPEFLRRSEHGLSQQQWFTSRMRGPQGVATNSRW